MLPGAFDSSYTKPTTTYTSSKPRPANAHAADAHHLHLEHAHWPLLIMLVFSQASAGLFIAAALAPRAAFPLAAAAFGLLNAGLFAAVFHLGRPLGAWRFFLGLRTSWMSREILAFSIMATMGAPAAGAAFLFPQTPLALAPLAITALLGLVAIFTSAMIYIDTRRSLWSPSATFGRFYATSLLLGAAGAATIFAWSQSESAFSISLISAIALHAGLFAGETVSFTTALKNPASPTHFSALTIRRLLPWLAPARAAIFALSTVLSALAFLHIAGFGFGFAALAFLTTTAGALIERYEFFTSVHAPHMPGGVS